MTARRVLDRSVPLLALIVLMLVFVHPLMSGRFPLTSDARFHLYRLIALDHAVRHGEIWPRLLPGMMGGYGLPIFNYYPPTSLYPLELLRLLGLSFIDAELVGLGLYALIGALGAYLLGKVWGGAAMGLVTAAGFMYSPFLAYQFYEVASVSQIAGLVLLPWVLWAFRRLALFGGRLDLTLAVGTFSLLILTHNITALYAAGLLVAYTLYHTAISAERPRTALRLSLAMALAATLSAFFWLPVLAEAGYVHLERGAIMGLDIHSNFRSLAQTLALPIAADPTWYRLPPIALGWPQIGLSGLALGLAVARFDLLRARKDLHTWVVVSAALCAILVLMTTPASAWVWDHAPLISLFQQPWRLLGAASLLLALNAGIAAAAIGERIVSPTGRAVWIGVLCAVFIGYTLPWLYIEYEPQRPPAESVLDVFEYERQPPYYVGTTTTGEYIPQWVNRYASSLDWLYEQNEVIPRLKYDPALVVIDESWELLAGEVTFDAPKPRTLTLYWAYFPGWRAWLDGEETATRPTDDEGLLSVEVPAGRHTLSVKFALTPIRRAATWISLGGLALLIALLAVRTPLWDSKPDSATASPPTERGVVAAAALAGVLMFGLKAMILDIYETPLTKARFADGVERGVEHPVLATFDSRITLLGYDLSRDSVPSGESVRLASYWQRAGEPIPGSHLFLLSLRNADGLTVLETPIGPSKELPTSFWPEGLYIREEVRLNIPAGLPPGSYTIHLRAHRADNGRNLEAADAAGAPLTMYPQIGTLDITRPVFPAQPTALNLTHEVITPLSDSITLLGMGDLPDSSEVGQPFLVTFGWRAKQRPEGDFQARLIWIGEVGERAESAPFPLAAGYPTGEWRRGDVWLGAHLLHVPGRLSEGMYTLALELSDDEGQRSGEQVTLGQMRVGAPPRAYDLPEAAHPADHRWQNGITLAGYTLDSGAIVPGAALQATLYWQPTADLAESLTVFMHLIDAAGQIVAQQDQIPAAGARPTPGWAPGEIIADPYTLLLPHDLPPGEYHLRIGWYNARTGARIPLEDGAEFILLPVILSSEGSAD